jgi:hypothetical protein
LTKVCRFIDIDFFGNLSRKGAETQRRKGNILEIKRFQMKKIFVMIFILFLTLAFNIHAFSTDDLQASITMGIIRETAKSDNLYQKLIAIEYIEDEIPRKGSYMYSNYLNEMIEVLEFLYLDAIENHRYVFKFTYLRLMVTELLGEIGTEEAKNVLLLILQNDNEEMILVYAIGSLKRTVKNDNGEIIANIVNCFNRNKFIDGLLNPDIALSTIDALGKIARESKIILDPDAMAVLSFISLEAQYEIKVRKIAMEEYEYWLSVINGNETNIISEEFVKNQTENDSIDTNISLALQLFRDAKQYIFYNFESLSDAELNAMSDYEFRKYEEERHERKNDAWIKALIAFLKSPDSLSVDMAKEEEYMTMLVSVSDDGRLRTYNWISNTDSNYHFDTIIQYDTGLGTLDAVLVRDITSDYYLGRLDYGLPVRIKENTYLLGGHARAAPFVYAVGHITITIEDGVLKPYLAFNNEIGIVYFESHGEWEEEYTRVVAFFDDDDISKFVTSDKTDTAQRIRIPYGKKYDTIDGVLVFEFNGTEFTGNYDMLDRIR